MVCQWPIPLAIEVLTSQFIENEYEKGADRLLYLILSVLEDSFIGGCVFFVLWKRSTIKNLKKNTTIKDSTNRFF